MTPEDHERMKSICLRIPGETNAAQLETLLNELAQVIGRPKSKTLGNGSHGHKPSRSFRAVARRIIGAVYPFQSERVEIQVHGADDLFRELRIENTFIREDGQSVSLKQGARVMLTFEAEPDDTVPKATDGHA